MPAKDAKKYHSIARRFAPPQKTKICRAAILAANDMKAAAKIAALQFHNSFYSNTPLLHYSITPLPCVDLSIRGC